MPTCRNSLQHKIADETMPVLHSIGKCLCDYVSVCVCVCCVQLRAATVFAFVQVTKVQIGLLLCQAAVGFLLNNFCICPYTQSYFCCFLFNKMSIFTHSQAKKDMQSYRNGNCAKFYLVFKFF